VTPKTSLGNRGSSLPVTERIVFESDDFYPNDIVAAASQGAYGVKKHLLALDWGLVSIGRMRPHCMDSGK